MTAILALLSVINVMGESSSAKDGLLHEIDSKGKVADAGGNPPAGINISIKDAIKGKGAIAAADGEVGTELPKAEVKKILVFDGRHKYLPWFLYDPLILSEVNIQITRVRPSRTRGSSSPDLSSQHISSYDLVIVPFPHRIKQEYIDDLLDYIDNRGALFLVQPTFDSADQNSQLIKNLGIAFKGKGDQTAAFSILTDHASTRILGLPDGRSVYPHEKYQPHMKFEVGNGIVLTRLSSGEPDLFVTSNGRVAITATDMLSELRGYLRGDPEYPEYKKNIGYLFINTVRYLLGIDFFQQPVQLPQQRWSDFFYAYAVGREFVLSAHNEKAFSKRLSEDDLMSLVKKADSGIEQAARLLVQGNFEECKSVYDASVKHLSECMEKMTEVDRYMFRGWHSSLLTPDYYGGGLRGLAEAEWMDHLIQWMKKQVDWITRTGSRRLIDIYPNDWEIMAKYYPDDVNFIADHIEKGFLEAVHGIYTAAYLPVFSEETNVRQFHYGVNAFEETLNTKVESYINTMDHIDFHPQLPQILNNYGFRYAVLDAAPHLGEVKSIHAEKILWRGLDGTEIESVPNYEGMEKGPRGRFPFYPCLSPKSYATADSLGYKSVLFGCVYDATTDFPSAKEHTLINPIAPVAGTWVTLKEFFEETPDAEQSHYLGVDDLWAHRIDNWSSWGCMNEAYQWNRSTENRILAAEKMTAISTVLDKTSRAFLKSAQEKLDESWKNLLRTQDHMLFGSVDYSNQILPASANRGERGKHHWGYDFDAFSGGGIAAVGGMENFGEQGSANYAGPMVSGSRYGLVKKYIKQSQDAASTILHKALGAISEGQKVQDKPNVAIPVTVFNQLGWSKRDIVTVEREFREGAVFHFVLSDGRKEIPYQVTSAEKYRDGSLKKVKAIFLAEIPTLGYKTYYLKPTSKAPATVADSSLETGPTRLENDHYIVEIHAEHGGINRIFDKQLGVDMVGPGLIGNELYSPADPAASSITSSARIKLTEKGPVRATLLVRSTVGKAAYECAISLYKDIKRIDFDLNVDYGRAGLNFGKAREYETGLFLRFPLNFTGQLYVNQPFGLYETKRERQVTLDFADLYQGQYGLALIHGNSPSYHYDKGILSMCVARGRPFVVGEQNYRYSIYTHQDDPFQGDVYNIAKSVNVPFLVHWPEKQVEEQSRTFSFLAIDKPNIVLSALYSEGSSIYARFYERSGQATEACVDLPYLKSESCRKVKLNGQEVQEIQNKNGKITLDFKPWEIVTLAFEQREKN